MLLSMSYTMHSALASGQEGGIILIDLSAALRNTGEAMTMYYRGVVIAGFWPGLSHLEQYIFPLLFT